MDSDFMSIWNSEDYVRIRKWHSENDFQTLTDQGIECKWCSLNRYANCEQEIEPFIKPMDLADYICCLGNSIKNDKTAASKE